MPALCCLAPYQSAVRYVTDTPPVRGVKFSQGCKAKLSGRFFNLRQPRIYGDVTEHRDFCRDPRAPVPLVYFHATHKEVSPCPANGNPARYFSAREHTRQRS